MSRPKGLIFCKEFVAVATCDSAVPEMLVFLGYLGVQEIQYVFKGMQLNCHVVPECCEEPIQPPDQ